MKSIPVRSVSDHGVQFLWRSHRDGKGILAPLDVAELFAQCFVTPERRVRVESVSDPDYPACRVRIGTDASVLLGVLLDEGPSPAPEVLSMGKVPWQRVGGRIVSTPGAEAPVALGLLAWMYGHEPATVRRLLENWLISRGRSAVSTALRLFELGWRLGPDWAPFRCRWLPREAGEGRRGETTVEEDLRYRKLTTTGGRALAHGALAAGLNRCSHSPFHPLVEQFVYEFRRGGGTLERIARDDVVARPARPTGRDPDGGPRLVVHIPGGPPPPDDGTGRQVVLRIERVPQRFRPSSPDDTSCDDRFPPIQFTPSVVLVPSSVGECYEFVRIAGRIVREWDRDVTILVDGALLLARGSLRLGPDTGGSPISAVRAIPAFLGAISPMNCRAFAPSVLSKGTPKGEGPGTVTPGNVDTVTLADVERVLPDHYLFGDKGGDVLLVSWGAAWEGVKDVLRRCRGGSVSGLHVTALPPARDGLYSLFSAFSRIVLLETDDGAADGPGGRYTMERLLRGRDPGHRRGAPLGEWPEERPTFSMETWFLPGDAIARVDALAQRVGSSLHVGA